MPDRYHVSVAPVPPRFRMVGKYGSIDWREDCSRCSNCVKLRCQYDVYESEGEYNRDPLDPVQPLFGCKACLSCVQGCTKGLLELSINPEFLALGDEYWTGDIIHTTWHQSETGRIPVSGAGYRGRFHGPGFDSIWTDMSEIVRPTRDGIHGREYISTSVDIGAKPMRLTFSPEGELLTEEAPQIELQIPAMLDIPAWDTDDTVMARARAAAAARLKTLAVVRAGQVATVPADLRPSTVPLLGAGDAPASLADALADVRLVEIEDSANLDAAAAAVHESHPGVTVAVRLPMAADAADRVADLAGRGYLVQHLVADIHGCEIGADQPRHIKDAMRAVHERLLDEGLRDATTLVVSGGIALAEHMAKAIICGADLVGVSTPLLVALGCRVCSDRHGRTGAGGPGGHEDFCPARKLHEDDLAYATQRMVNLLGAWHSQLIEVLGAMGIREVRRLRGEVGRAIFRDQIEQEAFGDIIRQ